MKTSITLLAILSALLALTLPVSHAQDAAAERKRLRDSVLDHDKNGTYPEGIADAEQYAKLCEETLPPGHYDTVVAHRFAGNFYQHLGRYSEAEPHFLRNLEIFEAKPENEIVFQPSEARLKFGDKPHTAAYETAIALGALAELFKRQARYAEAEPLLRRRLDYYEKEYGVDGLNVADPLGELASLYEAQGRHDEVEAAVKRHLAIYEKHEVPDSMKARVLHQLAHVYGEQRRYADAEPLYRSCIKLYDNGAPHPGRARAMNDLGQLLVDSQVGSDEIESLFQNSFEIYETLEKHLKRDFPHTPTPLSSLASYYLSQKRYAEAEATFKRCLEMMEQRMGSEHTSVASVMTNLAGLYSDQNRYDEAEPLLKRALEIRERQLGPDHPDIAPPLNNLAILLVYQRKYDEASPLFRRSLEITERHMGADHAETSQLRKNVIWLDQALGRHTDAEPLVSQDMAQDITRWRRTLAYFSERENLEFQRQERPLFHPGNQESGRLAAEAQLRFKGAVLEAMNTRRAAETQLSATEAGRRLLAEREKLGDLYRRTYLAKGGQDEEVKSLQSRLAELDKEATILLGSGEGSDLLSIGLGEIQATLGAGQVLVESFRYLHLSNPRYEKWRYAVTMISATGDPVFVTYGDAKSIDEAIQTYRSLLDGSQADAAPEALREAEATLRVRLLDPLEEHLVPGQTVIFSPDAQLHFIPLGMLRDREGKAFAEKYEVRYVSSGRDLVKEVPQRKSTGLKAFALGNPTYRDNSPMLALAKAEEDANKNILTSNLRAGMGQSSGSIQFRPLPGTAREVGSLSTLLEGSGYEVATLSGKQATEAAVKQGMAGHDIVHLATHGFFLDELKTTAENQDAKGPVQNPMFRSGLALAGAQSTFNLWKGGQIPPPASDGVLLAAELTGINLRGTDLVVLSACETAAGESLDGEGVMGLRRALNAAGATNVVMTLWPVDDAATVEVMEVFYQKYLSGIPAAKALAETQRELLPQWIEQYGEIKALSRLAPFLCTSLGPVE